MTPKEDHAEFLRTHEHTFLTIPGRCMWCGITDREVREIEQHRMLAEAFDRLAAVLEKLEAKL